MVLMSCSLMSYSNDKVYDVSNEAIDTLDWD